METYERAVNMPNCSNVNAHFYYGVLCEKMKDIQKAITLFKKCLVLDQEHFPSCITLATLLAQQGEN